MSPTHDPRRSLWPHRWAWMLACATFPLVWWGGFVTASGSGMAFKDWLTSDGVFMPLYPWLSSAGDKFIEHGHRLLGMLSGVLTIALVASLYMSEPRRWVRRYGVALLLGVLVQGVLGGMRVVLDERVLALIHGCIGPLFFAACAAIVPITSQQWLTRNSDSPAILAGSHGPRMGRLYTADMRLLRLSILTAVLAYLQLVIGAVVRHSPLMLADGAATVFQIAVYFHMLMAVAVTAHVLLLAHKCYWRRVCRGPAVSVALLIVAQVLLGLGTWLVKYGMPGWATAAFGEWQYRNTESDLVQAVIIAGHGAIGALIVALCAVIAVTVAHQAGLRSPSPRPSPASIARATA
jgi:cytochrome c oxidase assembly protein subunit 15